MEDEQSARSQERQQRIRQAMEEVTLRPLSIKCISRGNIASLLSALTTTHHLDGSAVGGPPPILLFRLSPSVSRASLKPENLRFFIWGCPGRFGASLTISALVKGYGTESRISLDQGSDAFRAIKDGRAIVAFVRGQQVIIGFEVDFAASPSAMAEFYDHWQNVESHSVILRDQGAHYWDVLENSETWSKHFTLADRLSSSWFRTFRAVAGLAPDILADLRQTFLSSDFRTANIPLSVVSFLDAVELADGELTPLFNYFARSLQEDGWLIQFLKDLKALMRDESWGRAGRSPGALLYIYLISSVPTRCGQAVPWIDGTNGSLRYLELEPDLWGGTKVVDEYWARLPDGLRVDWGYLITARDVPIDPPTLWTGCKKVKLGGDIEETEASIYSLLEEAAANKQWIVPPKALVELKIAPFAYCEIVEMDQEVYFVLRDEAWQFFIVSVNPNKANWAIHFGLPEYEDCQYEVEAAFKLLLAAIIRDFWVVEEREKIFGSSVLPPRIAKRSQSEDAGEEPRIVYVPRVRYTEAPNLERCITNLNQQERRQHFVSAHFRKAGHPSLGQLRLGQLYGFAVPTGYTFVRPHERGGKEAQVIYRSRSALQCLYESEQIVGHDQGRPHWFQFERDVAKLMQALAYEVQHVSASRRGDHGVDVYATRWTGDQFENWIIQCKCYSPHRKVGPSIVRELIGVLSRYEAGTKGMIVTTSAFTTGARDEAEEAGIRLITGEQFMILLAGHA